MFDIVIWEEWLVVDLVYLVYLIGWIDMFDFDVEIDLY